MSKTLFENAHILAQDRTLDAGWLLVEAGRIASYGAGQAPDIADAERINAAGYTLMPGFVDIHVHGGMGHDTMDASVDSLRAMAQFYAQNGVTAFCATTWTDSRERIYNAMRAACDAMQSPTGGAALIGVHMEGPYLNVDYTGAQNPGHIRRADRDEMAALFELDVIRLLAIAPEFDANHWLIRECVRRGVTVSVAHSGATYDQMQTAIDMGLTHSTHTYNAMTKLHHRDPGIVGAVLTSPHIRAEIIADTVHVHPAAVRLLWQAKGPQQTILITDAIRAAGMPDGDYAVDDRTMTVKQGECRLADGTLAGSIVRMNDAVRHFQRATGASLNELWRATSYNAAQAVNISHRKGSIATQKDADLVLVDDEMRVRLTMVEGEIVYQNEGVSQAKTRA